MFTLTIKTTQGSTTKQFCHKILISEALAEMGIKQNKPCGGNGTCGKCKVIANNVEVLACHTYIDCDTLIDYAVNSDEISGITEGVVPQFNKKPLITKGYGLAVDIGTTTIAGYLYQFPECVCVRKVGIPNTQAQYGADVISRIEYSNNGGLSKLQNEVKNQIESIIGDKKIEKFVITGNTTMLHLLLGLDPKGIAVSPFQPKSLFGKWYQNVYIPRCISAYVGADITTAVLAGNITNSKSSLLVDIGTNGEMALWHNGKLLCCSTAAGPAFEGAGINAGMLAVNGAINQVYIADGKLQYNTIGGQPPIGICGSGLIDVIACMLELNIIDETGYMEEAIKIGDSDIFITPNDVRQVQLAKAAIMAGIETLLHEANLSYEKLEHFYIAGGFGSYINKDSAAKIGLIPQQILHKAISIGNAAGIGATMILQSQTCLLKSEELAKNAASVELSKNPYFMDRYVENMMF